jgi:hypothetical protein
MVLAADLAAAVLQAMVDQAVALDIIQVMIF